ncbi:MAG TPA: N-acetylglucosamine-6-phosphate deacetylase [Ktedonobacteraceae bacterium]|nr:N-acetylglucosamine-6-phosphate deacetylase [Ktedonobacteraceae bacterium]
MSDTIHKEAGLNAPSQILVAGKLYTPEEIAGPVAVVLEGASIRAIWRGTDVAAARKSIREQWPDAKVEVVDLSSYRLAPGYIDLHTHGFYGHDITTGTQGDMEGMAHKLPQTGVTTFFPTIATIDRAGTMRRVRELAERIERRPISIAAEIAGLRLEGPFISRKKKGAQYEAAIRKPDPAEMEELVEAGRGSIRIVDFAPEEDESDAFLAALVRMGIIASIGHTMATYDQTIRAIDEGARHSTHLYDAMPPIEHRAPGAPGALLTDNRATTEIIADAIHVHPAMLKLAVLARGARDVALVTDATAPTGLPEGEYEFVGRKVTVRDGAARLENGSLAGSILMLDRAVRNMVNLVGLPWAEAIRMATQTPARIASLTPRKGSIMPGADADLVALDEQGYVQHTWTRGMLAYSRNSEGEDLRSTRSGSRQNRLLSEAR